MAIKQDIGLTPGRRKANQLFRQAVTNLDDLGYNAAQKLNLDLGLVYSLGPNFPDHHLRSPESDQLIGQLMQHLEQRIEKRKTLLEDFNVRGKLQNVLIISYYINKCLSASRNQFPNGACRT